jgi:hypothetical protein
LSRGVARRFVGSLRLTRIPKDATSSFRERVLMGLARFGLATIRSARALMGYGTRMSVKARPDAYSGFELAHPRKALDGRLIRSAL